MNKHVQNPVVVGAREANQQFSKLLKQAELGREILITRNGQPIARLLPVAEGSKDARAQDRAIAKMVALMKKGLDLGGKRYSREDMHER